MKKSKKLTEEEFKKLFTVEKLDKESIYLVTVGDAYNTPSSDFIEHISKFLKALDVVSIIIPYHVLRISKLMKKSSFVGYLKKELKEDEKKNLLKQLTHQTLTFKDRKNMRNLIKE